MLESHWLTLGYVGVNTVSTITNQQRSQFSIISTIKLMNLIFSKYKNIYTLSLFTVSFEWSQVLAALIQLSHYQFINNVPPSLPSTSPPRGQLPLPSPAPSQGLLSRLSIRRSRPRKNTRPRALPGIFGIGTASRAPFYGSLTLWCFYGFFRVWLGLCWKGTVNTPSRSAREAFVHKEGRWDVKGLVD